MLSIIPLKNSQAAAGYYAVEDYYLASHSEPTVIGHWWGKGADCLGLRGEVSREALTALLRGQLPTGQQLGRREGTILQHRPGYDLTFSAPKSVSVLALVGQDSRLIHAHHQAVEAALTYLQQAAAQTRVSRGDSIAMEKTDNLVVAHFQHTTSREGDPQLHTHCLVMNATQRQAGAWRSLSSEALFKEKMLGGLIYRATLAYEMTQLGYPIEKKHADGRFEIASVPSPVLAAFSQRRQQIKTTLDQLGLQGGKAAKVAALITRPDKQAFDGARLQRVWLAGMKAHGFDSTHVIHAAIQHSTDLTQSHAPIKTAYRQALHATRYACEHLAEREARFSQHQIMQQALAHRLGRVLPQHIEKAIQRFTQKGYLVATTPDQKVYTTRWMQDLERQALHQMQQGKGQVKAIANAACVARYLAQQALTPGQRKAATLMLTTHDKIIGIQGYAGTGKTTLLKSVRKLASKQGYKVIGLAPSAHAAQQVQQEAGIKSMTVHRYLHHLEHQQNRQQRSWHGLQHWFAKLKPAKQLIIVDEASLLSTRQAEKLQRLLATRPHTHLVYVGDTQQYGSIEAGKLFTQLQQAGMKTAVMKNILRQKNPMLLQAVHATLNNQFQQALAQLNDNVHVLPHKAERLNALAQHYLRLSPEERTQTLVLTAANADRATLNQLIRQGLQKEGTLTGTEQIYTTLSRRDITHAARQAIYHYALEDVIRFNKPYKSLGIQAGDYTTVTYIDPKRQRLILQKADGTTLPWSPHRIGKHEGAIEVYQKTKRALQVGDTIRWLRNDQAQNLTNADTAHVLAVTDKHLTLRFEDGTVRTLSPHLKDHQHWDYAYVLTGYSAQGKTCDRLLAQGDSAQKYLTHQRHFMVLMTRARYEVHLYLDDKDSYLQTLQQYTGEKTSALDKPISPTIGTKPAAVNDRTFIPTSAPQALAQTHGFDKSTLKNLERER